MSDRILMLMTDQHNFIRVRASHIRALWIGTLNTGYLLYVDGVKEPFDITDVSAKEAGEAMDEFVASPGEMLERETARLGRANG